MASTAGAALAAFKDQRTGQKIANFLISIYALCVAFASGMGAALIADTVEKAGLTGIAQWLRTSLITPGLHAPTAISDACALLFFASLLFAAVNAAQVSSLPGQHSYGLVLAVALFADFTGAAFWPWIAGAAAAALIVVTLASGPLNDTGNALEIGVVHGIVGVAVALFAAPLMALLFLTVAINTPPTPVRIVDRTAPRPPAREDK